MNRAFLFKNYNKNIISRSSSGGAFSALAEAVLKCGGIVYGAVLSKETGKVYHKRIDNTDELDELRKSKYVFSNVLNAFKECRSDISQGKKVLFVGAPCQIGGLLMCLKNVDTTNLITADFVCHGSPNPKYWESYLKFLNVLPPYNVNFRNKSAGWENYSLEINGRLMPYGSNVYMNLFLENYSIMPQCFNCQYKGDSHVADVTLGDAWGIKYYANSFYDHDGVSLVIIRNKENEILKCLKSNGQFKEVCFEEAISFNESYYSKPMKPKDYEQIKDKSWGELDLVFNKTNYKNSFKHKILMVYKRIIDKINCPKTKDKIGIISDFDYINFGNKLQSFALQKSIQKFGYKTYLLTNKDIRIYHPLFIHHRLGIKRFDERSKTIYKTSKKYEGKVFYFKNLSQIKLLNRSKAIVYGSDQIWNIDYNFKNIYFNLGSFYGTKLECPYIAYAASAGKENFNQSLLNILKFYLPQFSVISSREEKLCGELEKLGFSSRHVLDPTFLLTNKEWAFYTDKYSKIQLPKEPYVLVYGLSKDDILQSDEILKTTKTVVNCLDIKSKYYAINQFDFLKLIRLSDLVVTDSYHACIFSIIFGKPFKLIKRKDATDMQNRFETLFKMFNIKEGSNFVENYNEFNEFLEFKRASLDFLKKSFSK